MKTKVGANVVDLQSFRARKMEDQDLARGRTPLYSSHLENGAKPVEEEDFGTRMQRIRTSLEKINQIMWELKKNSTDYTH